jgi:hypothetical protein
MGPMQNWLDLELRGWEAEPLQNVPYTVCCFTSDLKSALCQNVLEHHSHECCIIND